MNKIKISSILLTLLIIGIYGIKKNQQKYFTKNNSTLKQVTPNLYWTCPMHPQIHNNRPGECPICHMALTSREEKKEKFEANQEQNKRSIIQISKRQLELISIQKYKVEKMSLSFHIPISGRLITSNKIAFQIYENDYQYIKIGSHFKGHLAINSDQELKGTITAIDEIVDPSSRTIRGIGTIQKNITNFISESSFNGSIKFELHDRLAIPENAILHSGNEDLVYIIDEHLNFEAKKITLGLKSDNFYEILSGLNENDIISSGPNFLIDSEAKIRGAN